MKTTYNSITFSDTDVLNIEDWVPQGEHNPYNFRPFLIHDHGFTVCVVFAESADGALDEAADSETDVLKHWRIAHAEIEEYSEDQISYLGGSGTAYDIEGLTVQEMPNPRRSFAAQFHAREQ